MPTTDRYGVSVPRPVTETEIEQLLDVTEAIRALSHRNLERISSVIAYHLVQEGGVQFTKLRTIGNNSEPTQAALLSAADQMENFINGL